MKYVRLTEACAPDERELAAAVRALRDEVASPGEIAALARRLAPELAAPSIVRASVVSSTSKWLVSLVLAFSVGLFATLQLGRRAAEPVAVRTAPVPVAMPLPATPAPDPVSPIAAPQPEPFAASPSEPVVAPTRYAPPRVSRPKPQPSAAVPEASPLPAASSAESELELLGRAQRALDRQPRAALALAGEHATAYPRGLFVQERELLAIQALLKLQQRRAAVERATHFLANYPTSPHARHLRPLFEAAE